MRCGHVPYIVAYSAAYSAAYSGIGSCFDTGEFQEGVRLVEVGREKG